MTSTEFPYVSLLIADLLSRGYSPAADPDVFTLACPGGEVEVEVTRTTGSFVVLATAGERVFYEETTFASASADEDEHLEHLAGSLSAAYESMG